MPPIWINYYDLLILCSKEENHGGVVGCGIYMVCHPMLTPCLNIKHLWNILELKGWLIQNLYHLNLLPILIPMPSKAYL